MHDKKVRSEWRPTGEDGERISANYGFFYIEGNKRPYFSVTANIVDKYGADAGGGCCHDLIAKHFPELSCLIRWHLVDDIGTPMHYIANGMYWMEKYIGVFRVFDHMEPEPSKLQDLINFKSHIVFGAVTSDETELEKILASEATIEEHEGCEPDVIETREHKILRLTKNWLHDRSARVSNAMKEDIAKFPEIEYIMPVLGTRS